MARPGMARQVKLWRGKALNKGTQMNIAVRNVNEKTNGGKNTIEASAPYVMQVGIEGAADLLFHRWNCEAVEEKAKAAKNSKAKKSDDVESYVYRCDDGTLALPGEYLRQSIVHAAKFRQDPRSPRKSAMDLFKAGIVCLTPLASLGKTDWDYLDTRRVTVQRNGINRTRPAMKHGWRAQFEFAVNLPEYIDRTMFREVLEQAGRLVGVGDFRPTFGRFGVVHFE